MPYICEALGVLVKNDLIRVGKLPYFAYDKLTLMVLNTYKLNLRRKSIILFSLRVFLRKISFKIKFVNQ